VFGYLDRLFGRTQKDFFDIDNVESVKERVQEQIGIANREHLKFAGRTNDPSDELDWSLFLQGAELVSCNDAQCTVIL
jgi:hypothetical protein